MSNVKHEVEEMWWEGTDLCIKLKSGASWRFTNTVATNCSAPEIGSLKFEPLSFTITDRTSQSAAGEQNEKDNSTL